MGPVAPHPNTDMNHWILHRQKVHSKGDLLAAERRFQPINTNAKNDP